jgi:hypothetical protein
MQALFIPTPARFCHVRFSAIVPVAQRRACAANLRGARAG